MSATSDEDASARRFAHLTSRELLGHRTRARRRSARDPEAARQLIEAIETELDRRRRRRLDRAAPPTLGGEDG